ncbi:MAG: hypothetical protein IJZ95_08185 [Oscillospiraceae bacterium]|nr:hypothetical protein [Oscillospiraceae bacterium]
MTIRPIPSSLLNDTVVLMIPSASGYISHDISSVRVVRSSKVSEYSAVRVRDSSVITVYYDCTVSKPTGMAFSAGMLIVFDGVRYELLSAEEFKAEAPHHIRLTAKKV